MLVIPLLLSQLAYAETAKDPGKKHLSPTAVLTPTIKHHENLKKNDKINKISIMFKKIDKYD